VLTFAGCSKSHPDYPLWQDTRLRARAWKPASSLRPHRAQWRRLAPAILHTKEEIMKSRSSFQLRLAQSCLALVTAVPLAQAGASTVISELLYDVPGTDSGLVFVELFGTPGTVLDGMTLEGVNGSDGSVYQSVTLSGTIPADGVFVIGDDSGDGSTLVNNADLVRNVDFQNGPDSVVLRDNTGILDALGYGDFTSAVFAGEGSAAADVAAGWSLARINPGVDTNNNQADFVGLDTPTPGLVTVSSVPLPPAVALLLSGMAGLAGVARRRH
jgi:hypothetical protein